MAKGPLNIERRHSGMSYSQPLKPGESVTSFKRQLRRLLVDVSFSKLIIFRVFSFLCLTVFFKITRNTCIAEPREARGWRGGGGHKLSGMEGGENWTKLGNLGGRVSTLALRLEGEM